MTTRSMLRRVAVWCGLLLVVLSAYPTWHRWKTYAKLQQVRQALHNGEFESALLVLEDLQRTHPEPGEIAYLIGVANRRLGRFDKSFQALQRAEYLGWPSAAITRQRYMARFQAGDITGTQAYLQQLLVDGATDEVAEEVYEALAKGFLAEFRVNDAAVVLDHWIAWQPDALQARRWRAELYEQEEDWASAAKEYTKLIEYEPALLPAYLHLGDALLNDLKVEEARQVYAEARRRFPTDSLACIGLAQCERRLGNPTVAIGHLQEVLRSDVATEFKGHALSELGQLALESSQFDEAARYFEESLRLSDNDAQTHHLLGTAYARVGRSTDAKEQFAKSQSILDLHRRMRALTLDVAKDVGNVAARFEIGNILRDLGRAEEASRWYLTVIHLDATHSEARRALAEYFAAMGETELAAAHRQFIRPPSPASEPVTR